MAFTPAFTYLAQTTLVGVSPSTCYRVAVAAQLTLLLYFELCVLVPLGSWNKQPGMEKGIQSGQHMFGGMIAAAQILLLAGTIWRVRALLWLVLVGDRIWLFLHGSSLWTPYIRGASPEYAQM